MRAVRLTKFLLLGACAIGACAVGASAVHAADYPQPQPYIPQPVIVEEFASWYLRGDIGMSNQSVKTLENPSFYDGNNVMRRDYGFDSAPIFGLGVGYYFNDWLRVDVTGEYRGRSNFHGLDIIEAPAGSGNVYTDEYKPSKSEWLFLANAYVDLGTWWSVTPFVGAGVGFSRNTIHNFTDINTPLLGVAYADDASKWSFAWALHAGLSYKVTRNFSVELAYRYVHLGDAQTGTITTYDGDFTYSPLVFKGLTSHDLRLGLRVNLDAFTGRTDYAPPPVSVYASSPQPAYSPPPVYAPQPQYAPPPPPPVYAPQPQYAPQPYPQQQYYPAQPYGRRY